MDRQGKNIVQNGKPLASSKEEQRAAALRDNLKKRKAFQQGKKQDISTKNEET